MVSDICAQMSRLACAANRNAGFTQERSFDMIKSVFTTLAITVMTTASVSAHDSSGGKASKVAVVYEHVLPNVPGKSIKGVLVEYGPGGFSEAHTHPQSAFIYATVLEGSIRSQVNGGPIKVYHAGESFSEMPGDRHGVSENGSKTKKAKLLAVVVVDTDQKDLTFPITE
jgi:quercetin dioxygenase-like cupin family protein